MKKLKKMKKWIWVPILVVMLLIAAISVFALNSRISDESLFNLSERDVVLEIGESKKVELELEDGKINLSKMEVTWVSSKPSVANVDKDGNITATDGGETRITAIVKYGGKQYTTS